MTFWQGLRALWGFFLYAVTAEPLTFAAVELVLFVSLAAIVVLAYLLTPLPPEEDQ